MTRPIVHRLLVPLAQGLRVMFLAVQEAFENHKHLVLRGRYLQLVTTTLALGRLQNKSWHSPVWSSAASGRLLPWGGSENTRTCSSHVDPGSVLRAEVFTSELPPNPPMHPWSSAGYYKHHNAKCK